MREEGTVVGVQGDRVIVRVKPGPQCGSCCACAGQAGDNRNLPATTTRPVHVGERVAVEVPTASTMLSAFLVFVLPLVGLLGGVLAGQAWQPFGWSRDGSSLLLGFGALAALFGFAAAVDRLALRKHLKEPVVVEVLGSAEAAAEGIPNAKC